MEHITADNMFACSCHECRVDQDAWLYETVARIDELKTAVDRGWVCGECLLPSSGCEPFECVGCGQNTLHTNEYYMIHDELWLDAKEAVTGERLPNGMLCIGCVESALGRELTGGDFTDAPVNDMSELKSERLASRLES